MKRLPLVDNYIGGNFQKLRGRFSISLLRDDALEQITTEIIEDEALTKVY